MSIDLVLNLVWLLLASAGLSLLAISERNRSHARWGQRVLAVLLIAISLFPCVSASDDIFSLSFLQTHKHGDVGSTPPEESKERHQQLQIFRILQSLEHVQVSAWFALLLFLTILALVGLLTVRPAARFRVAGCSRAPPVFSF